MSKKKHDIWSNIRKLIVAILTVGGGGAGISVTVYAPPPPPVPVDQLGWLPDMVDDAAPTVAAMPPFRIVGARGDNSKANVRHWLAAKAVNGGQHLPNVPQEIGDCVSRACKHAIQYLQCNMIDAERGGGLDFSIDASARGIRGPPYEYHPVYSPYIYGISRVQVGGGRIRGDGSVGAWAAEGCREYGVLRADLEGVPSYSGTVARKWGQDGPPSKWIDAAREFLVRTVAPVRTTDDVRDAICNGYPVTIASRFGSERFDIRDGRRVARGDASWSHQMAIIGYDGSASAPYWYVINSWGDRWGPKPLQDEPPGGFWITASQLRSILSYGDSFAFSGFDGFPSQMDFTVTAEAARKAAQLTAPVQFTEPSTLQVVKEEIVKPDTGYPIMGACLALAILVLLYDLWRGKRRAAIQAAALILTAVTFSGSFFSVATVAGGNLHASDLQESTESVETQTPLNFGVSVTTAIQTPRNADPSQIDFSVPVLAAATSRRAPQPLDFAVLTRTTPDRPTAYIYHTEGCLPCRMTAKRLGVGDERVRIKYRLVEDSPEWVQERVERDGTPLLHYKSGDSWKTTPAAGLDLDDIVERCGADDGRQSSAASPTPKQDIDRALQLLGAKSGETAVDFGCGADARFLIRAAQYGCRGIGIEIDPQRAASARETVARAGLQSWITIIEGDARTVDVEADFGFAYLYPDTLDDLKPQIAKLDRFASYLHPVAGLAGVNYDGIYLYRSSQKAAAMRPATAVRPVAYWNGQAYTGRVCSNGGCRMCNSIQRQLR